MSDNAENVQTDNLPPAEEKQAEPMVPKHRLDEQAQQIRLLQEQIKLQQEAMGQMRQHAMPQPSLEIEELKDLDPSLLNGLKKLVMKEIQTQGQPLRAAVGSLAERTEEQNFILEHGKDKKKYVPQIRARIREYAQKGMPMDFDTAYKMIRFDEMESAPARAPKQEVVEEKQPAPSVPQKTAAKHFNELSLEDMESQLEGPI